MLIDTVVIPNFHPFSSISYRFRDKPCLHKNRRIGSFFQNFEPMTLKFWALTMKRHIYSAKAILLQSLKMLHPGITEICSGPKSGTPAVRLPAATRVGIKHAGFKTRVLLPGKNLGGFWTENPLKTRPGWVLWNWMGFLHNLLGF